MPNPEDGCEGLDSVFGDNLYKFDMDHKDARGRPGRRRWRDKWVLTAAISGAHTLGSARPENSGYEGFWSDEKNSGIFNNNYYISMLTKGWGPDLKKGGNPEKNQWDRIDIGKKPEHLEFLLDTDICLAYKRN